jgi:hypothetical protein
VTPADLDTQSEIAAFDVVVLGGPGSTCTEPDYTVFDAQVETYVRNGGGLVAAGWIVWQSHLDGAPGIEAVLPAYRIGSGGYLTTPTVTPVAGHPISEGLSAYVANEYAVYGGGAKTDSTVFLESGTYDLGEAWTLDAGRSVYLGPMFFEAYQAYDNEDLLDGSKPDAIEMMLRAIEWAAGLI